MRDRIAPASRRRARARASARPRRGRGGGSEERSCGPESTARRRGAAVARRHPGEGRKTRTAVRLENVVRRLLVPLCALLLLGLGSATTGRRSPRRASAAREPAPPPTSRRRPRPSTASSASTRARRRSATPGSSTTGRPPEYGSARRSSRRRGHVRPGLGGGDGAQPGTTYHFRLRASAGDVNLGMDVTFMTPPPPSCGAVTGTATSVTTTTATLNGQLGGDSGSDAINCGAWRFDYGPTTGYGSATPRARQAWGRTSRSRRR